MGRPVIRVLVAGAMLVVTLGAQTPQTPTPPTGRGGRGGAAGQGVPPPSRGGGGGGGTAGPADKPLVDFAAAERGKEVWIAECINCHGTPGARHRQRPEPPAIGPHAARSLRQRNRAVPEEGAPDAERQAGTSLTDAQITDLAHFLRQQLNDSLRGSPSFKPGNVLTGDAKAGAAYFNGAGKCSDCHSPTGDLAGIGGRFDAGRPPAALAVSRRRPRRSRPRRGRRRRSAITVTVTPPVGAAGLRRAGADGRLQRVAARRRGRVPQLQAHPRRSKVVKTDPLAAHIALLDTITDKNIHDVVAYLETLK